jgi:hypothetical protein
MNELTESNELWFPAMSVTRMVQFECVPSESVLNVMVLFPAVAAVVAAEQSPPYVMVPASVELNV